MFFYGINSKQYKLNRLPEDSGYLPYLKYIVKKYHKDTPDKDLLDDLRNTARSLGKDYISMKEYAVRGKYHSSTIYSRFGGWNTAAAKAGLKIQINRNVTDDELMINLKNVWDKLGRQPKHSEMVKPISAYGKVVYANRFGSWLRALDEFVLFINRDKKKSAGYAPEKILHNRKVTITPKHTHKGRKKLKFSKTISDGLRFKIFRRDYYKCRICGRSPATHPKITLHVDHIIPRSKGGETTPVNLQTLCD